MSDSLKRWGPPVLSVLLVVGVVYVLIRAGPYLGGQTVTQDVKLPLLAITGIIALLASLALVAVSFATLNLTDSTQALALPEGSVRAVIALCLVVLFAIISVSLYSSLAAGPIRTLAGLTSSELDVFTQDTARVQIISVGSDTAGKSTVTYRQLPSRASEDFAKQLLVMVGTLVTSVASFYFGTRAAAVAATGTDKKAPSIVAVTPDNMSPGSEKDLELKGTNLLSVTDVVAVKDATRVHASGVTSNDTVVKCTLKLDATAPPGKWDLLASDPEGRIGRLGGALTVA
jgi:hypothetical protein